MEGFMILVATTYDNGKTIEVDRVVQSLVWAFGATITSHDSFETERVLARESMAELEKAGRPIRNPEMILASIRNKERALGPAKEVSIPIGPECSLNGRVSSKSVILRANCALPNRTIDEVSAFLESLDVGAVRVATV